MPHTGPDALPTCAPAPLWQFSVCARPSAPSPPFLPPPPVFLPVCWAPTWTSRAHAESPRTNPNPHLPFPLPLPLRPPLPTSSTPTLTLCACWASPPSPSSTRRATGCTGPPLPSSGRAPCCRREAGGGGGGGETVHVCLGGHALRLYNEGALLTRHRGCPRGIALSCGSRKGGVLPTLLGEGSCCAVPQEREGGTP